MSVGMMFQPVTAREDTIAACATPPGVSGIAVIRVSGTRAIDIAQACYSGAARLPDAPSHTAHHGRCIDAEGRLLDDVLVTVFRAPRSYTGEDCVEIGCHGGSAASPSILDALGAQGARHARPGEFTLRAFLNGRMDLAQAEAVADLIHARSNSAYRASLRQLDGALSTYVDAIRSRLLHCAAMLELSLDFAEEDVRLLTREELLDALRSADAGLRAALDSHASGRIIREGIAVALTGAPNTGKSSLLNALLDADRAIVTDTPGTTRDYIEESVLLGGTLFRLIDTAGLRTTDDPVERAGIRITERHMQSADMLCMVMDATALLAARESTAGDPAGPVPGAILVQVLNKIDLVADDDRRRLAGGFPDGIQISALTGEGLPKLIDTLVRASSALAPSTDEDHIIVTNARHADCLNRSLEAIIQAIDAARRGLPEEVVASEVRRAMRDLDELIGVVTNDDILHSIFSRFCIGK